MKTVEARNLHLRSHMLRKGVRSEEIIELATDAVDSEPDQPVWGKTTAREVVRAFNLGRFKLNSGRSH
jgi:hypothetical protein